MRVRELEEGGNPMMIDKDVRVAQEHYKDLLREAERDWIAHQALARRQQAPLQQRALVWLGSHFVTWGSYLQERYSSGISEDEAETSFDSNLMPHGNSVS